MFIATLFIIAKKWKQPKCPDKMWYRHKTELLFSNRNEWNTDT